MKVCFESLDKFYELYMIFNLTSKWRLQFPYFQGFLNLLRYKAQKCQEVFGT